MQRRGGGGCVLDATYPAEMYAYLFFVRSPGSKAWKYCIDRHLVTVFSKNDRDGLLLPTWQARLGQAVPIYMQAG